ncbi:MoaD/ThiS family protein [Daejeonella sp.]|uniref:MoaD/ThiS family protein n=1 Tax=Daejeonella sp. TaxID=2805397 RepID=UPI0037C0204D
MQVHIMFFGQLTDITGTPNLILHDIPDTKTLQETLNELYPALAHTKYAIAMNNKTIQGNSILSGDTTIALLPPFSGG